MEKKIEIKLWEYLVKQVGSLDNNYTARKIFNYVERKKRTTSEKDLGNQLLDIAEKVYDSGKELEARFNLNKLETFIKEYENKKDRI